MLKIKDTSVVPPEDWSYYVHQTNITISTKGYELLYPMIVEHCQSNGLAIPSQQDVIDQMCERIHISCYDSESRVPLMNKLTMGVPVPVRIGCCGSRK